MAIAMEAKLLLIPISPAIWEFEGQPAPVVWKSHPDVIPPGWILARSKTVLTGAVVRSIGWTGSGCSPLSILMLS
jgi:hypothetical protein